MRAPTGFLLMFAIAAATGLGLTTLTTDRGGGAAVVTIGPWVTAPRAGTPDADPYSRAIYARLGALPLALGDGVMLLAETDDEGRALDGRCAYRVVGPTPPARFWTLAVVDAERRPVAPLEGRRGLSSVEAVRLGEEAIDVQVSARARPGHWLPTGGVRRFAIALRVYDSATALSIGAGAAVPAIRREGCP